MEDLLSTVRFGLGPDHPVFRLVTLDQNDEPEERKEEQERNDPESPFRDDEEEDRHGGEEGHPDDRKDAPGQDPRRNGTVHRPIFAGARAGV